MTTEPTQASQSATATAPAEVVAGGPAQQRFYDSATWPQLPPAPRWGMLYRDGRFAAFQRPHNFQRYRWITVTGDGRRAGAADWHPDNNFRLDDFVDERASMGVRARVYASRERVREALNVLGYPRAGHLWTYPGLLWWIPTLDNRPGWTPELICQNMTTEHNVPAGAITPAGIWAIQWGQAPQLGRSATYDISTLFGEW